jgi:hypothetical protein
MAVPARVTMNTSAAPTCPCVDRIGAHEAGCFTRRADDSSLEETSNSEPLRNAARDPRQTTRLLACPADATFLAKCREARLQEMRSHLATIAALGPQVRPITSTQSRRSGTVLRNSPPASRSHPPSEAHLSRRHCAEASLPARTLQARDQGSLESVHRTRRPRTGGAHARVKARPSPSALRSWINCRTASASESATGVRAAAARNRAAPLSAQSRRRSRCGRRSRCDWGADAERGAHLDGTGVAEPGGCVAAEAGLRQRKRRRVAAPRDQRVSVVAQLARPQRHLPCPRPPAAPVDGRRLSARHSSSPSPLLSGCRPIYCPSRWGRVARGRCVSMSCRPRRCVTIFVRACMACGGGGVGVACGCTTIGRSEKGKLDAMGSGRVAEKNEPVLSRLLRRHTRTMTPC